MNLVLLRKMIFPILGFCAISTHYSNWMGENTSYYFHIFLHIYLLISILGMAIFSFQCILIKSSVSDKAKLNKEKEVLSKIYKLIDSVSGHIFNMKITYNKHLSLFILTSLISIVGINLFYVRDFSLGILFGTFTGLWFFLNEYNIEEKILTPAKKIIDSFE